MKAKRDTVTRPSRPSWTPRPGFTLAQFFRVLVAFVATAVILVSLIRLADQ
jgi:hypothetical protein